MLLLCIPRGTLAVRGLGRSAGLRHVWRQQRTQHSSTQHGGTLIYEALSGNAIRVLKFMSVTGAVIACTATVAVGAAQTSGALEDADMSMISMLAASLVSVASTLVVNKTFGPFVTRITLLPATKPAVGAKLDAHGLPKFDTILTQARGSSTRGLLASRVTNDTELLIESPGVLGINSRTTRVRIKDLVPSARNFRTWELTRASIAERREKKQPTPLTNFTVLWKTLKSSPNKDIMQEINSMIGPV